MDASSLLALAGLISGCGAIISAWAGLRHARRTAREEGASEAVSDLQQVRLEAERLAGELHECRMQLKGAGLG